LSAPSLTLAEWLEYQQRLHPHSIDLGLERVQLVAERLELLPLTGKSVIVGGTNGKGSTANLIAALARAHGGRVGLFTSPHLLRYEERVQVNGAELAAARWVNAFERIEAARGPVSLTYFEFNALAALLLFQDAGVNTTVLEVGLGGRLDATNIVAADVAVLCSVGMDHSDWLGSTLEQIGAEKAGIFRAHQTVVLGSEQMPHSVERALRRFQCRVQTAGVDFHWLRHPEGTWDYRDAQRSFRALPAPALAGEIQYRNAACALAAWADLSAPAAVDASAVAAALRDVRLPGRLQFIPGPVEWVLDVAHNEPAAQVLAEELGGRRPRGRTTCVLGMLSDKDVAAVAARLDALVDHWVLCGIDEPRGLDATQLQARLGVVRGDCALCDSVTAGCQRAAQCAVAGDRVVVCGSFHTVGPALKWLELY